MKRSLDTTTRNSTGLLDNPLEERNSAEPVAPTSGEVQLIPFQVDHKEQVFQLYREVFGPSAAESFQERWQWAQEQCLYPGYNPKWVLVDRERVVGFLSTIPLPYIVRGIPVLAHTPCDYMVHPEYRFHGIGLLREFFRSCENCVTCDDMPSTIKVTRWLGARPVGRLVRYVKVLDPRALRPNWRWAGAAPMRWPICFLLRGSLSRLSYPRERQFDVEPVSRFDLRFEDFFHKLTKQVTVTPGRDLQFLEWRYGRESPHGGREIGVIADQKQELLGYVIFYLSRAPHRSGYILDLQTLPQRAGEVGNALLGYAGGKLRDRGAWSIRYHHLASPHTVPAHTLRRHGFIPRGCHQFLVRFRDPAISHFAGFSGNWSYSYGDSEASHSSV